jgi:hypothetical protein
MTAHALHFDALRLRPLLLPAVLLSGGVAVGGVAGFLLIFVAGVLAVDRALDLTGGRLVGAETAFRRARRRRGAALAYLADDRGWAATSPRRRLGVQPIALETIVGTTDRHKAEVFDRGFRPPTWSRGRWSEMYDAASRGASLPPVSVYRVGAEHFIRDGHHRVSVARSLGALDIDAMVVELVQPSERIVSVAHSTAS